MINMNRVKRFTVECGLDSGGEVYIVLDQQKPGVDVPVPPGAPMAVLCLSNHPDFEPAIPDLWIDDDGFVATLDFAGKPYTCQVPWDAVHIIRDSDPKSGVLFLGMPLVDRPTPPSTPKPIERHLKLVA